MILKEMSMLYDNTTSSTIFFNLKPLVRTGFNSRRLIYTSHCHHGKNPAYFVKFRPILSSRPTLSLSACVTNIQS